MKVAIVQAYVDARRGGAETSTVEMARALAALGLNISVLCRSDSHVADDESGLHFVRLAAPGPTRALRTYRFVKAVHADCRSGAYDIVHAVTPCLCADVYQPRGGTYRETVARNIALIHEPALRILKDAANRFNIGQRFLMRIENLLLGKYQQRVMVAALSNYVRRQVEAVGFPSERVRLVYNGVNFSPLEGAQADAQCAALRAQVGVAPTAALVLFAAHNFKLKGLAELIRATALASDEGHAGWALVVAGRDRPRRYWRLARNVGIASRVHFAGTEQPMRAWYAAADALAHPTWYDPCSRVVLEALCAGLPVVTTVYNGAAEIMEPGRHGEVIATPADISSLSAAIRASLAPEVRAACRADAANMQARLSIDRHARELRRLYENILSARQRGYRA